MIRSEPSVLSHFLTRFLLQPPSAGQPNLPRRQAAVLVPIIAHPEPTLLLTRRAATLRKHAGQVAFPGGMMDSSDTSLVATALREAWEEVAIPPDAVNVIGVLPPVTSSTGFQVTPVVGILPAGLRWQANEGKSNLSLKCRWRKRFAPGVIPLWIFIAPARHIASGCPGSMTTLSGE